MANYSKEAERQNKALKDLMSGKEHEKEYVQVGYEGKQEDLGGKTRESELSKVTKSLENHYCEMTKFDDKIVIRCLADDNYDLKKTLNFIMKNIIHDKLPISWDL